MNLETEAQEIAQLENRLRLLQHDVEKEEREVKQAEQLHRDALEAQEVLQHLAQAVQQQAHQHLAEVVSLCLSTVFADPYEFKIVFERKRGRTEASLRFVRDGLELDPLTASGGGVVDVAAFALRIACLVLHRPRLSRPIVLDEPFRFVSRDYQANVRTMLEKLSEKLGLQVVMVTHNENLVTGKVVDLS